MSRLTRISVGTKRLLLGRPFRSDAEAGTRLRKRVAMPALASDAVSSVAYAPEQIFLVLALAGLAGAAFTPWVGCAVAVVMVVVIACYRQNVHAFPSGGGDYEVATVTLGRGAGLTVGSALLIDYALTLAVSVSAAAATIGSAVPALGEHRTALAAVGVVVLAVLALRGARRGHLVSTVGMYAFLAAMVSLIGWGLVQIWILGRELRAESASFEVVTTDGAAVVGAALAFVVAKSFASGSVALTGVQAIHSGVPAFRRPRARNASTTLVVLGVVAVTFLVGLVVLARRTGVRVVEDPATQLVGAPADYRQKTMLAQLAETVFAGSPALSYAVLAATAAILLLAANSAFSGCATLASVLARDGHLPRQLATRGDRLVFSNGIILLAAASLTLVVVFDAGVTALIQLYIVGVFVAFTLSQLGMVRHWTRELADQPVPAVRGRIRRSRAINAVGFVLTATVLVIVLATKFVDGAYIVVCAMVLGVVLMNGVRRHYDAVARELADRDREVVLPARIHCVVLVSTLNQPVLRALAFARATRPDSIEAVTVNTDTAATRALVDAWHRRRIPVPLKVIESPYREVARPVVDYVRRCRETSPGDVVSIYIPEYLVERWWEQILHNQSALRLKSRLLYERGVMVTSVPWHLSAPDHRNPGPADAPDVGRRGEPEAR